MKGLLRTGLSKHERLSDAPFDKLRVNGDSLTEQYCP